MRFILILEMKIGFSLNNYIEAQSKMNIMLNPEEQQRENPIEKTTSSCKQETCMKIEEQTASKTKEVQLDQSQQIRIRNQLFSMFRHSALKGKIKVQDFVKLSEVEVTLYHKIKKYNVQQIVRILFTSDYPLEAPKLEIHSCNLSLLHPEYVIPNFISQIELLTKEKWTDRMQLSDVIAGVMANLEDFHQSEIERVFEKNEEKEESGQSLRLVKQGSKEQENSIERKVPKNRRKSSNMTGCADKELTETKNLNRHFRSKLREVLRDMLPPPEDETHNYTTIDRIFTPNRVGFEDIRRALSNKWFNSAVRRQMNSGQFLHKILRGMMGIKSKKLMIKYYHVMVSAVEEPVSFTRWKYD